MNLLVVGLGSMGKRRARLAQGLSHAVCGVDGAAPRRAEAEGLGVRAFPALGDALAAGRYDAAFVCTAPLSHAEIIDTLLTAGLPVFTELNLVSDGYPALLAKAEAQALPLFLSSTMLYRAEIAYIAEKLASFAKPVRYIYHIGQYLPDWHPWEHYKDFFVGDARTGGVREIFGIELPWLYTVFGKAAPLCAVGATLSGLGLPYPDSVLATLRHESGAVGQLAVDVVSPKPVRRLEIFGEGLHLFWEGSPASLYEYDAKTREKRRVDTYPIYAQDPRYSDNIVENAYLEEMLNFFEVLQGKAAPRWSFEKDGEVICLMDELERMAAV